MYQILILTPIEKILSNPVLVPTCVNVGIHCIMYTIQCLAFGDRYHFQIFTQPCHFQICLEAYQTFTNLLKLSIQSVLK